MEINLVKILYLILGFVGFIVVAINPIWGVYLSTLVITYSADIFGLTVSPARLILIPLVIGFAWQIIKTQKYPDLSNRETILILAFYLWLMVSYLMSSIAIENSMILRVSSIVVVYLAILYFITDIKKVVNVLFIMIFSGWLDVVYGISDIIKYKREVLETVSQAYSFGNLQDVFRPMGLSGDPNYMALYLTTLMPIAYYLFLMTKNKWLKIFYAASFLLFGGFTIETYSRGGFLGLALVILLILFRQRHHARRVGVILVLIIFALILTPARYYQRIATIPGLRSAEKRLSDESIDNRIFYNTLALRIFVNNPVFGIGMGNFTKATLGSHVPEGQVTHNSYLEIASETGIIGLVLFISIIIFAINRIRWSRYWAKKHKNFALADLSESMELALYVYILGACFLSAQYEKSFWYLIGLYIVVAGLANKESRKKPI